MSEDSVEQLIESVKTEIKDTEDNYTSEEAKAEKDQRAKQGTEVQQAPPEEERKRSEKPQPQTRVRVQNPRG
jgi:hypothetical protein